MAKKNLSKSIGGFSIIEFMVAFAILGGLVVVLLQIRSFTQQSTSRTQANSSINTYNAKLSGLLSESAQTLSFSMAAQENHNSALGRNLFDINGDLNVGGDEKVDNDTYRIRIGEYFDHLGDGYPLGILRIQTRDVATGQTVTETLFKAGTLDPKSGIAPNGSYCTTYPSVQCPFQPVIRVKPDCSKDSALAGKCLKPTWKFQIDYLTDPELASRMGLRGAASQNASIGSSTDSTALSYRRSVVYAGSEAPKHVETPTTGTSGNSTASNTTDTAADTTTAGNTTVITTTTAGNTTATTTGNTATAGTTSAGVTGDPTPGPTPSPSNSPPASLTAGNSTTTGGSSTVTAGTSTAGNTTATATATATAGNTNGCFVAGTLIETLAGPTPIEAIQKGDWVWSRALDGTLEVAPVEEALQRTVNEVLDLHLSNGTRIRTTSEHPFWVEKQNDYLRAEQLLKGDALFGFRSGKSSQVEVTEAHLNRQVSTRVFNLTVAGNHNYFAGGVLVHNKNFGGDCCGNLNLMFNGTQCCDITSGACSDAPVSCTGCAFCVEGGSCSCPGDAPGVKSGVSTSCLANCTQCGCNCGGTVICGPPGSTTSATTTTTGATTTAGSSTTGGSTTGSASTSGTTTGTTGTTTGQATTSAGSSTTTAGNTSGSASTGNTTNTAGDPQISCLACEAGLSGLANSYGSCVDGTSYLPQQCSINTSCSNHCYCCNGAVACVSQPTCCNCQPFAGKAMDCKTFAAPGCTGCTWTSTCGPGTTSGGTTTSSSTTSGL